MSVLGAQKSITSAVLSWDGVTSQSHRFGGVGYRIDKRETGHIHGDHLVDIPFPTRIRDEIVASGEAKLHHILPESGWVSFYIHEEADVERAIALLQRSFEIARKQTQKRTGPKT